MASIFCTLEAQGNAGTPCLLKHLLPLKQTATLLLPGQVHLGLLEGRVVRVIWPIARWGPIKMANTSMGPSRCLTGGVL
jgi:hypothetical protein